MLRHGKKKIVHIITGLSTGGTEIMLYKLLSRIDRSAFDSEVISLTNHMPVGEKIESLGVPVRALRMGKGVSTPLGVFRLAGWLRNASPDVVQTWMYHADLIGGVAAKIAGARTVIWGIRNTNLDRENTKITTLWTVKAGGRLSRWIPERIICCSDVSRQVHIKLGYAAEKMVVLPNGFDLDAFKPDPAARISVRRELELPDQALLIGLIARFDPQKDHHNFIQAAGRMHNRVPNAHYLLCGDGITWENNQLVEWVDTAGIRGRCSLLGRRQDLPRLTAALDLAVCSSFGEAFPNVVGEAMACGVPCAVTDVGDSAMILGETGRVVPPRDPRGLANAWVQLLELSPEDRRKLGQAARDRVRTHFNLPDIVVRYEDLYKELMAYVRN